jgi:predicted membrane protein
MSDKKYTMTAQAIVGIIVLLLGIILTLGNFDIIDSNAVLRFWPLLLVIFGAMKALQPGRGNGRLFGTIIATIGVFMLLDRLNLVYLEFHNLWPLLLIIIGGFLMLKAGRRSGSGGDETSSDHITGLAILGGIEQRNSSLNFKGGSVSAVFGAYEIDLRQADIPAHSEAVLEVFALFGGVELKVPDDWTVLLDGSAFLGGFESKTRGDSLAKKKLIVRGQAIFGGVEVRN